MEKFMLYDENRRLLGLNPAGQQWYVIRERKNSDLQRNMLPLRFREYMESKERICPEKTWRNYCCSYIDPK